MARKPIKKVKNAVLYDDGLIRISNVRLSYPHLDKPYKKAGDKGEAKYSVMALLPKDTHAEAKKLIERRIQEVLDDNKVKALSSDKKFLRDGDESDKEEHEGCWTVSAREDRRPKLREMVDGEISPVEPEEAKEAFYGGCWASILIRPWYMNNDYGKRVNAGLSAVTKKADDEAFGEDRITDEDVDEAFEDEDEMEAPRRRSSSSKSKGSKSRYDDEDEDGDKPRRRRSRDDDDDEEERPRRRRARDDDPDDL